MKSLVDGIGTLTKGGLVVKTEVGEDIWDLDISRWGDVAIMDVGRVVIMGVEGKLAGGGRVWQLYFFHKSCPIESRVRSFNNSPKCMIKIFLESDKFSHKAGVTKHATNNLARKSQFCRASGLVLRGLSWEIVVSFLDDIVFFERGFEDHMKNMEQVLSWFWNFKLKLKPSKCELLKRDIRFGSQVDSERVSPNQQKATEVEEWPIPRNKADLTSFLGLIHLYSRRYSCPSISMNGAKVKLSGARRRKTHFKS